MYDFEDVNYIEVVCMVNRKIILYKEYGWNYVCVYVDFGSEYDNKELKMIKEF